MVAGRVGNTDHRPAEVGDSLEVVQPLIEDRRMFIPPSDKENDDDGERRQCCCEQDGQRFEADAEPPEEGIAVERKSRTRQTQWIDELQSQLAHLIPTVDAAWCDSCNGHEYGIRIGKPVFSQLRAGAEFVDVSALMFQRLPQGGERPSFVAQSTDDTR